MSVPGANRAHSSGEIIQTQYDHSIFDQPGQKSSDLCVLAFYYIVVWVLERLIAGLK